VIAEAAVRVAFKGRRGHGGGPITKRVLLPAELHAIVIAALSAAETRNLARPAVVASVNADQVRFRILTALVDVSPDGMTAAAIVEEVGPLDQKTVEAELGDLHAIGLVDCDAQTRAWKISR
jgi:hypothetical protein